MSRDTFAGVLSAPQTGNRYAYALDNPLRYTDPSGRFVNWATSNGPALTSALIQAIPGVGDAYSFLIGATGFDPIAGVALSDAERGLAVASAVVLGGGFWLAGRLAGDAARDAARDAGTLGRALDEAPTGSVDNVVAHEAEEATGLGGFIRQADEAAPAPAGNGWKASDFVQEVATRAEKTVSRRLAAAGAPTTGAIAGTFKHSYAERLTNHYQSRFGPVGAGLHTEVSYRGGTIATRGAPGSVRLDVVEAANPYDTSTIATVFDYKFFSPPRSGYTIPVARQGQIRVAAGLGPNAPIIAVQP